MRNQPRGGTLLVELLVIAKKKLMERRCDSFTGQDIQFGSTGLLLLLKMHPTPNFVFFAKANPLVI